MMTIEYWAGDDRVRTDRRQVPPYELPDVRSLATNAQTCGADTVIVRNAGTTLRLKVEGQTVKEF